MKEKEQDKKSAIRKIVYWQTGAIFWIVSTMVLSTRSPLVAFLLIVALSLWLEHITHKLSRLCS